MSGKKFLIVLIVIFILVVAGLWLDQRQRASEQASPAVDFKLLPIDHEQAGDSYIEPVNGQDLSQTDNSSQRPWPAIPGGATQKTTESEAGYLSQDAEINIIVDQPIPDARLTSPFVVSGQARDVSGSVRIQVINEAAEILIDELANIHSASRSEFGNFQITLTYEFSSTKLGYVQIFSPDGSSAQPGGYVKIPVIFD